MFPFSSPKLKILVCSDKTYSFVKQRLNTLNPVFKDRKHAYNGRQNQLQSWYLFVPELVLMDVAVFPWNSTELVSQTELFRSSETLKTNTQKHIKHSGIVPQQNKWCFC